MIHLLAPSNIMGVNLIGVSNSILHLLIHLFCTVKWCPCTTIIIKMMLAIHLWWCPLSINQHTAIHTSEPTIVPQTVIVNIIMAIHLWWCPYTNWLALETLAPCQTSLCSSPPEILKYHNCHLLSLLSCFCIFSHIQSHPQYHPTFLCSLSSTLWPHYHYHQFA